MKFSLGLWAILIFFAFLFPTSAIAAPLQTQMDQLYATHEGHELHYDLLRSDNQKRPLLILLHGGGWWSGSRSALWKTKTQLQQRLTRAGFVTASIEYRLTCGTREFPRTMFDINYTRAGQPLCGPHFIPQQVSDVHAAVAYFRTHADQLNIDPQKIGLLGYSAGGHLALLSAATAQPISRVQAVSNWSGPSKLDFIPLQEPNPTDHQTIVASFSNAVGCKMQECPGKWHAVDPSKLITTKTRRFAVQNGVGRTETQVTLDSVIEFDRRLTQMGFKSEALIASGSCHGSGCSERLITGPKRRGSKAFHATVKFMQENLA